MPFLETASHLEELNMTIANKLSSHLLTSSDVCD